MYKLFTDGAFARVMRAGDSRRFNIDLKTNRAAIVAEAVATAGTGNAEFSKAFKTLIKQRQCHSIKNYSHSLILRSIARYLGHRFRIAPRSRDSLVKEVIETLGDSTPIYIIRRDIQSFYETLPTDDVKRRLVYSSQIPSRVRRYIKSYFSTFCPGNGHGIPRGIGMSSVIAELVMQSTDQKIREIEGIYKYFRYSDDILIFSYIKPDAIIPRLEEIVKPTGLRFNRSKSYSRELDCADTKKSVAQSFEYLGYKFSFLNSGAGKNPRVVSVGISDRKISKIKTRIICALKNNQKHPDLALLRDRIRFLASNYYAFRNGAPALKTSRYVRSGIYYNYHLCGEYKGGKKSAHECGELKSLDAFYHSLLMSKKSTFSAAFGTPLGAPGLKRLRDISFYKGFSMKMTVRFHPDRVQAIKAVWRNA
ncbi:antiviral reverse transcriptase Drt3a [Cupriavidus metallidurans]|uniref:antiviral reverse transcriptase Drt3a n=1 Tax=Cupriavidus metallidurans TaxID=119219 RepID=UPI003CFDB7C5